MGHIGSGFVYHEQGHIVTNGHIVGDAKVVDVTFVDGNRYSAKVIASDIYKFRRILVSSYRALFFQLQMNNGLQKNTVA